MDNKIKTKKRISLSFLLSPWAILSGITAGVLIGLYSKDTASKLATYGEIYLSLLKMCVLPILLSAVASSIGGLLKERESGSLIKSTLVAMIIALLLSSSIGLMAGLIGRPGADLKKETEHIMGAYVTKSDYAPDLEISYSDPVEELDETPQLIHFIASIIPSNIFNSLSEGNNIQVLFFAIILGISIGIIPSRPAENLISILQAVFLSFVKVIHWAMYLLPFGLLCLIADQVSQIGTDIITMMLKFLVIFHIAAVLMVIIGIVVIWQCSQKSFTEVLSALKEPIILVLSTRSGLATLPSALYALTSALKFDKVAANLLLPLGITLGRFGHILYFAFSAVFISQLYGQPLGLEGCAIIIVNSIIAGMATSGAAGSVTIMMMLIILEPLGLPFEAAMALFIAVDPIIEPMRTLVIVSSSSAVTAYVAKSKSTPVIVSPSSAAIAYETKSESTPEIG